MFSFVKMNAVEDELYLAVRMRDIGILLNVVGNLEQMFLYFYKKYH